MKLGYMTFGSRYVDPMDVEVAPFDLMGHKQDPGTPLVDPQGPAVTPFDME